MRLKNIILSAMACLALMTAAQPAVQQEEAAEWYLNEVVDDMFVGRNYFDYYYTPSAADMAQQRDKGEVTYFLNSPEGLNSKKVRDMIDRLMASYDDVKAMCDWQTTTTTYWREFRYEKNKFRFSVKRKALEDGTYYVSVTESANWYKSLGKKDKEEKKSDVDKARPAKNEKSTRRSTRDRRAITQEEVEAVTASSSKAEEEEVTPDEATAAAPTVPVVSEKERRRAAREREEAQKQEERLAKRKAREEAQQQEKAQKEAEKQRKAEEKKQREEEKRLKREEEKRRSEQERQEKAAARKQASAPKPVESHYHYSDVALWLSEKYDFTQTSGGESSCTMYSTAVKDVEMAKLAIKNALKGSNARMAVPWRLNSETQEVETGYTVDDHVLVFAIGKNGDGNITVTVTEVSNEQFELFKQSL